MVRVYLAGPLFGAAERRVLDELAQVVEKAGHVAVIPHREVPLTPLQGKRDADARQAALVALLEGCDALIAVLDGLDVDGGTCFEVGAAATLRRPILGLRTDVRLRGETNGINLMVAGALTERVDLEDWTPQALTPAVTSFLQGVHVFAGRLVRDGVPRLAKERGHEVAFTQVASDEMPRVLKRRIVELAREMEAAEFGVEQESLSDLLELVESLIRVRRYDKESLRSMKEGMWRRRGGYEKGYVVESDPPAL